MKQDFLTRFCSNAGAYTGQGLNHEGQKFTCVMAIRPMFKDSGAVFWFRAQGLDGEIFHEETVLVGRAMNGGLSMSSLNSNMPALQNFIDAEGEGEFLHGAFSTMAEFRERVLLRFEPDGSLYYAFAWGMPGQPVAARSAATMVLTEQSQPADSPVQL